MDTSDELDVWAVYDGITVDFDGDPTNIHPVLRVRGRNRDFALLKTPSLGILTCSSCVANNVYESLIAARGRSVLFFPVRIRRSVLIDFKNDSIADSLDALDTMFTKFCQLINAGNEAEAAKYVLYGVRLDTSGSLLDVFVPPLGNQELDPGVTPRLVFNVRQALDAAWERWDLPVGWK